MTSTIIRVKINRTESIDLHEQVAAEIRAPSRKVKPSQARDCHQRAISPPSLM